MSVTVARALYIDWNPETIAAAQRALRLTSMRKLNDQTLELQVGVESEANGEATVKSDEGKAISTHRCYCKISHGGGRIKPIQP